MVCSDSISSAGQERFGNMTRVYYREAMGAFIVFDVTRPSTFEAVIKWKEDLDAKLSLSNDNHVAAVLLANKCDQGRDVLTNNGIKMEQFCQENGFVGWFETSAKVRLKPVFISPAESSDIQCDVRLKGQVKGHGKWSSLHSAGLRFNWLKESFTFDTQSFM